MDSQAARRAMIDNQLRPEAVTDAAVLAAMAAVPREEYVAPEARADPSRRVVHLALVAAEDARGHQGVDQRRGVAAGALALTGLGGYLPSEFRIVALALYALVVVPLAHLVIINRSLRAVLVDAAVAAAIPPM